MRFHKRLKKAMDELGLSQVQLANLTNKSRASISLYLNDKALPPQEVQDEIFTALGLSADYGLNDDINAKTQIPAGKVQRLRVADAAKLLRVDGRTLRYGLQQGVFPWGYGIKTGENKWTYFINAARLAEIEGVTVPERMVY